MATSHWFSSYLKKVDMFGVPIQLTFKKKQKFKTAFGAVFSLFLFGISLFFLVKQSMSWMNMEISTAVKTTENNVALDLLKANKSIEYNLTHDNYYIFFSVYAFLPDFTVLNYQDLQKYFTIEYFYTYKDEPEVKLETENCKANAISKFLDSENDGGFLEDKIWSICIKDPLKMGFVSDSAKQTYYVPILKFRVKSCSNTTVSFDPITQTMKVTNNSLECASTEKIKEMMNYVMVQASIPNTIYDFKNLTRPIQRIYKDQYFNLDWNLKKMFITEISPNYLYKDVGLFTDNYNLDSLNFNPSSFMTDISWKGDQIGYLYEYVLVFSLQTEKVYIRNQKLNEVIGSFGGMINVFYTLMNLISFYMNKFLLLQSLLIFTFKFKKGDGNESAKVSPHKNQKIIQKLKENFSSLRYVIAHIFPSKKEKRRLKYENSRNNLDEYMDIRKIIERSQDLDKIKKILFSDSQRFFFDLIPKPEFHGERLLKKKSEIFTNSTNKRDVIMRNYQRISESYSESDDRLMKMIDDEIKRELSLKSKNGSAVFMKRRDITDGEDK